MAHIIKEGRKIEKHFCQFPGSNYNPSMERGSIWECDCGKRYKVKIIGMGHDSLIWRPTPSPKWWNLFRGWLTDGATQKAD